MSLFSCFSCSAYLEKSKCCSPDFIPPTVDFIRFLSNVDIEILRLSEKAPSCVRRGVCLYLSAGTAAGRLLPFREGVRRCPDLICLAAFFLRLEGLVPVNEPYLF